MGFKEFLESVDAFVWGPPLLILLLGAGVILTVRLKGLQFSQFGFAMRETFLKMFEKTEVGEGEVTPFQALSTALAATVGTGNVVGVAVAIITGGPGAVFWMWVAAAFGMITKYSEVTLAIAYRIRKPSGEYNGGPMYYIDRGMDLPWLGWIFALFAGLATFGIGNSVQSNAIAGVLNTAFGFNPTIVGIILAVLTAIVIVGGIQSIVKVTEKLVPFMALLYIIGGIVVLVVNRSRLGGAIASIFTNAFSPQSAAGGVLGYTLMTTISAGISRGLFTNEAGLGSSPIAHATASTDHPVRQGLWGITEVFLDTFVICSITALVILSSGVLGTETDASALTATAFSKGFPFGGYIVSIGLTLFAFSTILGWEYYGETSMRYIFGDKVSMPFRIIYVIVVFLGCTANLDLVWTIANILNALMAIPNLVGLIGLSGVIVKLTNDFLGDPERIRTSPKEYEHLLER